MKKLLLILFSFVAYFGGVNESFTQSCPDGPGIIQQYRPQDVCFNEKRIWWDIAFTVNPTDIDPALFDGYFVFNWGDDPAIPANSTIDVFPAVYNTVTGDWEFTNTGPLPPAPFNSSNFAYFGSYPQNLGVCEITATVSLEFMGAGDPYDVASSFKCSQLRNSQTSDYYSFDNQDPGELVINPQGGNDITVCEGGAVVTLFDDSRFNCVAAVDTDNPNDQDRHIRWVYGVAGSDMDSVVVDQAGLNKVIYDVENFDPGATYVDNYPPIVTNASDDSESLEIRIPESALPGDVFIVRMDNWNPCNPYNPGDPNNPPPVSITKRIVIVDAPAASPQVNDNNGSWIDNTSNPNAAASFCVGEEVDFRARPDEGDTYEWDFDWDGNPLNFNDVVTGVEIDNRTFGTAGKLYQIGLRVTRGNTGPPCVIYDSIFIQIEDGPVADFDFNITSADQCESVTFNTINNSTDPNTDNEYTWEVFDDGGNPIIPTNFPGQEDDDNLSGLVISGVGAYDVKLTAYSPAAPNCPTDITKTIYVYSNPVADFSATEVCLGDATTFTDLSYIPDVVNGDAIETWEFVFDFDPTAYATDPEGFFDTQTITTLQASDFTPGYDTLYTVPGEYKVALRVTSDSGACVSPVDTATVIVKANPDASLDFDAAYESANGIDYSQPICPGVDIALLNTSTPGQTNPTVDEFYALIISQDNDTILFDPSALLGYWNPNTVRIVDVSDPLTELENSTGALYNYEIYMIAVGDNGCETVSTPITVTLLPEDVADFEIYEEDPGNPDPEIFDPGKFYCSPIELFFETDSLTKTFNADEYNWLITDAGTGDTLAFQNITPVTNDDDERFSFNFENSFPNVNQRIFNIELEVITNNFCIANRRRSVTIYPEPTSNFVLTDVVAICDSVSYRFEAQQSSLQYNWSVEAPADPGKIISTVQNNNFFLVNIARPTSAEADLDFEVSLFTRNLVNCFSDTTTFDSTVYKAEDIIVDIDFIPNNATSCLPAEFDLQNTTNPATIPTGTTVTWAFEIEKFDSLTSLYVPFERLEGSSFPSNEDFGTPIPYEFTQPGGYRVDLLATAESNCVFGLGTPIEIEIFETPEVQFSTNINEGCAKLPVTLFENSSSSFGTPYDLDLTVFDPVNGITVQTETTTSTVGFDGFILDSLENTGTNPIDYEITMVASNAFGCSDSLTRIVRVFPRPQIDFDINSTDPACEGDYFYEFGITTAIVPDSTIYRWTFGTLGSKVDSLPNNQTKEFFNPNVYNDSAFYTVTLEAITPNGCSAIATKQITLLPMVRASFFKFSNQICSSDSIEFESNSQGTLLDGNHIYERRLKFGTGTWAPFTNSPDASGSVFESFTNTTDSTQVYEIQYSVYSDAGGCIDTADIQEITVFPEPTLPDIVGPGIVCEDEQNVKYYIENHISGYKYQWLVPDDATFSAIQPIRDTIIVDFGAVDLNSSIKVIVTDANFCTGDTVTLPITMVPGPDGSIRLAEPTITTVCPGDQVGFVLTLDGPGTDGSGFEVIIGDNNVDSTFSPVFDGDTVFVTPDQNRSYELKSVIDLQYNSCEPYRGNSILINVNAVPTAGIRGNATICEGEQTELTFNFTGRGPWDFVYTDGDSFFSETSNTSITSNIFVAPDTATFYTLVSVEDQNCVGTVSQDTVRIEVNPAPGGSIFTLLDNGNVCINTPITLGFNLNGVGPWTVRYQDDDGNIFAEPNIQEGVDHNVNGETIHLFEVTPEKQLTEYKIIEIVDSKGCSGPGTGVATVTTLPTPVVRMTGNATICEGESANLVFNFPGAAVDNNGPFDVFVTINDVDDTLKLFGIPDGHIEPVSPDQTTNYRVVTVVDATGNLVSVKDNNGCPAYDLGLPVRVRVRTRPTVVLEGMDSICYGEETPLTFTSTGVGPWKITYTDGTNNFTFTTPFNRHFEDVSPLVSTTYSVVSVEDGNTPSCSNTGTGTAEIKVAPELIANFTATPENMSLPIRTVTINNTTTNKNDWTYEWDFGDSTTSTAVDPEPHVYDTYGTYFLRMTATNGECTDIAQTIITIEAIPAIPNFVGDPIQGCLPLTVNFENLTQFAEDSSYLWNFGDNQSARVVNPIHTYTRPGVYSVTLAANNKTGIKKDTTFENYIRVFDTPQSNFSVRRGFEQVFTGDRVEFSNSSTSANQYLWDFGDGNESTEFEPVHIYSDSGIYNIQLIAINSSTGCVDTLRKNAQVLVIGSGEVKIANAFTPSRGGPGSGRTDPQANDFFLPQARGVSQYDLKIYNRWGELLFESDDKDIGWDGYYKGELMPMGVYVYRLELQYENGRREVKLGDVTLIR